MTSSQFTTFYLDGVCFAVPVAEVQEVLRPHELTPVPLAPGRIEGLMNLRGQIITTFDLRERLGLGDADVATAMNVVVGLKSGPVSLLVDSIGDVLMADDAASEPPPDTLTGPCAELVSKVYKLAAGLLLVLDVEKAVASSGEQGPGGH